MIEKYGVRPQVQRGFIQQEIEKSRKVGGIKNIEREIKKIEQLLEAKEREKMSERVTLHGVVARGQIGGGGGDEPVARVVKAIKKMEVGEKPRTED